MRHAATRLWSRAGTGRDGTGSDGARSAAPVGKAGGCPAPAQPARYALALVALLGGACSLERPRPISPAEDLHDPNPSIRSRAVSEIARRGDDKLIPELIELLDDEDSAVRLLAGQTLRELTGRDGGYRAYAPEAELRRQVEDWRAWWASRPASKSPAAPPAPRSGS